ncbi:MAG: hypothetical protein JJT89_13390, partial [Nitriliruptoraceae bacterium]|nr:hypothetical protein [Nitriliruptoraceae bacterium]
ARPAPGPPPRRPAPPPDTTLLATLHVARAHRDHGFGTLLVHAALRDAVRVGHDAVGGGTPTRPPRYPGWGRGGAPAARRAAVGGVHQPVVAYGDRRHTERACYLPATWLLHVGFTVHLEHPRTPLLRLDTSRAARWAGSLEQAFEELLGRLPRRVVGPVPIGDTRPVPGASSTTLRARPLGGAPGRGPVEAS